MEFALIALAGAGLAGCLGAALAVDGQGRSPRDGRRLRRPRTSALVREPAA